MLRYVWDRKHRLCLHFFKETPLKCTEGPYYYVYTMPSAVYGWTLT